MDPVVIAELVILSILGIIGNAIVIAVYVRQKLVHSAVIFILTLAVTDLITCFVTIPFTIATEAVSFKLKLDFFCKLYYFLLTSTVPFSAFMMTVIAVDRFLCIVGPFRFRFGVLSSRIVSVFLAVIAATSGVITSLMFGVQPDNHIFYFDGQCLGVSNHLPGEAAAIWQTVYSSFYLVCGGLVVLLYIIIYIYIITKHNSPMQTMLGRRTPRPGRIQTELTPMNQSVPTNNDETPVLNADGENVTGTRDDNMVREQTAGQETSGERLSIRKHIRLAFMLSIVAFVYLICFLPAWLMSHGVIKFNAYVFYFYFSYHVTNPIIYSLISRSFRRKLARQCGIRSGNSQDQILSDASVSTSINQD